MERNDFIFYTNFIEGRGYEIGKDFVDGGCIGKYRYNKGEWKYGKLKNIYKLQIDLQKDMATSIYKMIKNEK